MKRFCLLLTCLLGSTSMLPAATAAGKHKLVLIAGKPSHPPGMHEFRAGTRLLAKCLTNSGIEVVLGENGWVADEAVFAEADAVVIYADGGAKHPAVQEDHLATLKALIAKGVGFGCMHYGVEVVPENGGAEFKDWLGGHYENSFSCNPIWEPNFASFPDHPTTRGVKPFQIQDEWYMNMRFRPAFGDGIVPAQDAGTSFVPILVATPPDATRDGPYVYPKGPYPHIQAEKGQAESMMWAVERPDGGRGFGFTGGHFHLNWGNENFRKVILNTLLWVSKAEVPAEGVASNVSEDDLKQNLDDKPQPKAKPAQGAAQKKAAGVLQTPGVFRRVASAS